VRESLASALLANGQAEEAEGVLREAITKRPRDGRLLFALKQTLTAQGRDSEAVLVHQQYRAAWGEAGVHLIMSDQ
jgi:Flp pilus assembly protein TadD